MVRALACLVVLLCPVSAASAGWSAPAVLVEDGYLADLVARPDGSARAALGSYERPSGLSLRDAPAGGIFGPPRSLVAPARQGGGVALSDDGAGIAVVRAGQQTQAVLFNADGVLGEPYPLGPGVGPNVGFDVATDAAPSGTAAVAWLQPEGKDTRVMAAVREPGRAGFGAPMPVGYALERESLIDVGIADSGEAVIAWQRNGGPAELAAAVRLPGAGFSTPHFVARRAGGLLQLSVGPDGHAVVAPGGKGLRLAFKRPGQTRFAPVRVVAADKGLGVAGLATGRGDRVAVLGSITAPRGDRNRLRVYLGTSTGNLRRVATFAHGAGGFGDARIALGDDGSAVVGVAGGEPKRHGDPTARARFRASYMLAGGSFGPLTAMGPVALGADPVALAVLPRGRALAAFRIFEPAEAAKNGEGADFTLVSRFVP